MIVKRTPSTTNPAPAVTIGGVIFTVAFGPPYFLPDTAVVPDAVGAALIAADFAQKA